MKQLAEVHPAAIKALGEYRVLNLIRLADFLSKMTDTSGFQMDRFADHIYTNYPQNLFTTQCGSIGCGIGHGTKIGIRKYETETWEEYGDRCFAQKSNVYEYLFHSNWVNIDNTPEGVANRIWWYLRRGRTPRWYRTTFTIFRGETPIKLIEDEHRKRKRSKSVAALVVEEL